MTCSIAGCDRPAKARTWCPDHYNNWYRRGDALLGPRPKRLPDRHKPLCDRFWSKVDFSTPDGCWEWRGSVRHELGYGEVWVQGKRQYAHRTAYEIVYGDIPEGDVVRHRCDNPRCVRPEHLLTGSQAENLQDARVRGRASQPPSIAVKATIWRNSHTVSGRDPEAVGYRRSYAGGVGTRVRCLCTGDSATAPRQNLERRMNGEPGMEVNWRRRAAELGLDGIGLAARPFHILVRAGITLDRLLTLTRTDLLAFKNLGETSVRNIEARLADRGLSLTPDPPARLTTVGLPPSSGVGCSMNATRPERHSTPSRPTWECRGSGFVSWSIATGRTKKSKIERKGSRPGGTM